MKKTSKNKNKKKTKKRITICKTDAKQMQKKKTHNSFKIKQL